MTLEEREINNEINEAIEFAIRCRNQLTLHEYMHGFLNEYCVLRDRNITLPTEVIFDIYSENRAILGVVCISDGRFTNRGRRISINNLYYVECLMSNYNGAFITAGAETIEHIIEIITFMKEVIDYELNYINDLDYVRIPDNLLEKWFIPISLRNLNIR